MNLIEKVINSVEEGVRRVKKIPKIEIERTHTMKLNSKIFGKSLKEICQIDNCDVPYILSDLCTYIKSHHLQFEGIFRLSASAIKSSKLKQAYESYYDTKNKFQNVSIAESLNCDACTCACMIKYFLRNIQPSLLPEELLFVNSKQNYLLSDENFACKVRSAMQRLPSCHLATLNYLLEFLKEITKEPTNKMNISSLSVVISPNVFQLHKNSIVDENVLNQQLVANKTFERLLLVSEEICKNDVQTPTKLCSGTSQDKTEKNKRLYQHGEFNNKKIKNMQGIEAPLEPQNEYNDVRYAIKDVVRKYLFSTTSSVCEASSSDLKLTSDHLQTMNLDIEFPNNANLSFDYDDKNEVFTQNSDDIFENTDVLMMSSICEVTQLIPKLDLSTFNHRIEDDKDDNSSLTNKFPVSNCKTMLPQDESHTEVIKKESKSFKQNQQFCKSEEVKVPNVKITHNKMVDDVIQTENNSGLRWMDNFSLDENSSPVTARDIRASPPAEEIPPIEEAPSSPNQHYECYLLRHNKISKRRIRHNSHNSTNSSTQQSNDQELRISQLESCVTRISNVMTSLRQKASRPDDVTLMTINEIKDEKNDLQRLLLEFESAEGRPKTKVEREIVRVVYDRYRTVKRLLAHAVSPTIPNHIKQFRKLHSDDDLNEEKDYLNINKENKKSQEKNVQVSGNSGVTELNKQLNEAKHLKKKLRRKIRDFEKEFKIENGKPPSHSDLVVIATEYSEYREVRSKLRLLEALIEKEKLNQR